MFFPLLRSILFCILFGFFLTGCTHPFAPSPTDVKIGVVSGPHQEIMIKVQEIAAQRGLTLQIVPFDDYIALNQALEKDEIQVNSFQTQPYLNYFNRNKEFHIVSLTRSFYQPMALYSSRFTQLADLPEQARIILPADPQGQGRALRLLEKAGSIVLRPTPGLPDIQHIEKNLRQWVFEPVDQLQLPSQYSRADLAVMPTAIAAVANLVPEKNSLFLEDAATPYAFILAIHEKNADIPAMKLLTEIYHSPEVEEFIFNHFQGSALPAR